MVSKFAVVCSMLHRKNSCWTRGQLDLEMPSQIFCFSCLDWRKSRWKDLSTWKAVSAFKPRDLRDEVQMILMGIIQHGNSESSLFFNQNYENQQSGKCLQCKTSSVLCSHNKVDFSPEKQTFFMSFNCVHYKNRKCSNVDSMQKMLLFNQISPAKSRRNWARWCGGMTQQTP